ncbi:phage tail spike protein [Clostridium perfringens]|uniref:phage tail spike protein n=2 Tax=Clostridium perfringens TaxID=1502 RepID=UPI001CCE79D8|nr:phage tail spike protein [Clostridium perfringens]EGT0683319.1 hypothetical protein [Clostridium perfringens]EGT0685749.1 hypothetical protein [Clostridium perfringens]UBL08028.1 phage tail protein [Clostridium perfringens]
MIELRDKDKNRVAGLVDYENLCIESVLDSGDKTLSFYYPKKGKYYDEIVEESYIRTKKDEFVVKARELDEDYTKFECSLNLEELEGNIFDRFESVEQTITSALNLAIVGTGWTVKDNTLKKRRTVRCTNKSSLEIVREIKKVYRVDIVFNTLGKQIEIYEHLGEDKGTYFIDSLNLIALQVQSDSRQYATRIIAEGKDGLSFSDINNGKNYVENYQYSNKVKTIYWKDERYSVKENLLEDARAKLEELSKPFRSYSASILNLAELNPRYSSILDFKLGDAINLISKKNKIKDKQRIVKTIEWPQDHTKDSVELANATLKFEDIQQENQETTSTVNNITVDDGTIDGSTIDGIKVKQIEDFKANVVEVVNLKAINASIDNLHANKADIQDLHAVTAKIGTLEANKANITQLNATNAEISKLNAIKANITDLNAANGKISILESKTASIDNLLAGNLTANNFKANSIVAGSGIIADGAIGSAQISSLSVNKLEAGDITTSKHRIVSADGTIEIVGNQILINRNNVNRVVLGEYRKKDGTTEYGLLVRAKDGQTVMLDGNGVHNAGITDGAIDNNKVADNANISGNKLDINSVIREVNTHGTETIAGTRIQVGDRTLDIELSTQKNTITEHSKELSSQKATIQALDNAIKLKVDSQTFTQSTTTINNNINRAKEEAINSANNAINNLQISFRNLAINSNFDFGWKNWGFNNPNNNATVQIIKDSVLGNCVKVTTQTSGQGVYSILKRKPKTTYSWSFMIKSDKTCKITVAHEYGEGTKEISLTTEWTKITGTGIWNGNGGALCFYSNVDNPQITYYLTNLIYVEGDKVGDWTPAPEDLKAYSDDVAKAKADLAQANAIANADGKITTEEQKRIQQAQENLNIAISKADKAKQDAIDEANRVAELKKQEAINSANSHADSKANEALNNAKAFVNAEITTVNSHLNKATAEINVLKKQIELKVGQSDVDKSIEDVKFGGRNLWLNTAFLNGTNHFGFYGCENINVINIENEDYKAVEFVSNNLNGGIYQRNGGNNQKIIPFEKGENLIISGYFKCSSTAKLRISLEGSSYGKSFTPKASNEWTYFELKAVGDGIVHTFTLYGSNNNKYTIRQIKVEKGTKATDWTKAPEDTDQLIVDNIKTVTDKITTVESKFTQENNSIKASVQDLNSTTQSITTNVSNINRDLTSKINSNLDAAKNFATDIATNKANTAKQEAINNAKAYTNAEITTVNSKVHNVESNLNILSDRINTKVSQSDIDKAVTTIRTERIIYARGTGNDYPANSIVKVNGKTISDGQGRGLRINALNKATLERVFLQDYDTFGSEDAKVSFVNKINELNNGDFIIIITSQDASYPLHQPIKEALEKIGATLFDNKQGTYREAYALIGKSKLGRGNGVEMFIPRTANDKRFAEVSVKVGEDGTFIGVNSNNMGLEATLIKSNISDVSSSVTQLRDSVTTDIRAINSKTQSIETTLNGKASKQEVTEVNNRVATIKASLDGITQRVSATESKTQTLEININGKASKEEIVSINSKVASIETSLSGITNRVSSTESKTSSLEVSINSTNSELNILKNSISTKLEKIDSHIKYGSTNLLINTEFLNNFYNWNKNQYVGLDKYQEKDYVGVMIQNNRIGTEGTLWQRATLKTEVTYTLSFEEYTDDISRWWVGIYYKLNGATKYITLFDSSVNKHSWQKRVFQFKLPSGATETDVSFYNYGGSVGRVWVCNLQLEEGEFATPYKSNPLDFSKFSSAITQTVEGINTEVSKKVNGRDIISTINQSAESVKINASRINLQGYVTVGDLGSTNVTTINNAHITSGTIEGRTMIALNGTGKQNGVLTVNNGESYLEYFRCREAWMMSPYANGWRVPLVHSKYGIKDNESSSDMIDEIAFYRGTDGRNYLQITNTKTGRVEYIELYRSAFDTVTILNRLDRIDAKLAGL